MPGKSHGQRSLVGYSPWGRKESDTTELLHFTADFKDFYITTTTAAPTAMVLTTGWAQF